MENLDIMDLFVSVLLCLVMLPLAVSMIHKQEAMVNRSNSISDKNVKLIIDSTPDTEISGKDYNAWEVLLTTQIQSYYMSKPKTLSVMGEQDGTEKYLVPIDVTATFKEDRDVFIEQFRDQMQRVGGLTKTLALQGEDGSMETKQTVTRYELRLNQGAKLDTSEDDFYYFRKVD